MLLTCAGEAPDGLILWAGDEEALDRLILLARAEERRRTC
jgi:hypothetical protein